MFGEFEFFSNCPYLDSAKSDSFTSVYKISLKNFIQILKMYPEQYVTFEFLQNFIIYKEKFCFIKDKLLLNNDFTSLSSPCFSCGGETHNFYKCPLTTYAAKKSILIDRVNLSKPQIREPFQRKKKIGRNLISDVKSIRKNKIGVLKIRLNSKIMDKFHSSLGSKNPDSKDHLEHERDLFWNTKNHLFSNQNINTISLQSFRDLSGHQSFKQKTLKRWKSFEIIKNQSNKSIKNTEKVDSTLGAIPSIKHLGNPKSPSSENEMRISEKMSSNNEKDRKSEKANIIMQENSEEGEKNSYYHQSLNFDKEFPKTKKDILSSTTHKTRKLEEFESNPNNFEGKTHSNFDLRKFDSFCSKTSSTSFQRKLKAQKTNFRPHQKESLTTFKLTKLTSHQLKKQEREKNNDNLFDYEFENSGSFNCYFLEGNCKTVIQKINQRARNKMRRLRTSPFSPSPGLVRSKRRQEIFEFKLDFNQLH